MRQLQEQREYNRRMLEAERASREQQSAAERDWREQDRNNRAAEAAKVEARHQHDSRSAERRFWLGLAGLLAATILGQLLSGSVHFQQIIPPAPTPSVALPAAMEEPPAGD